ncbi:tail tube protein [Vibrio phage 1.081.O._10N.286.52.C2]|nr:tail tube protein [Vibrio phage 1.081.O._10N.286.52.C2]
MLNVDNIKRAFSNGDFARPNLFEVEIPFLGQNFKFQCRASSMPPGNVEKVEVSYQNRKYNIAGDRTFDDWNVTVYNDELHGIRKAILEWQARAVGLGKEVSGGAPEEYKRTGTITQLDRNGDPTATVSVFGIFPTVVGEIALDWDSNNEIETFETTFSLDYFTIV